MPQPTLEARGLGKRYGDRVAVAGLCFSVEPGEIFGLLGPNGAGKTTSIAMLSALIDPDEGEVTIAGHDLKRHRGAAKRALGLVPQELALYPTLSARDNLAFFGRIYGLQGSGLRERVDELLGIVGLGERARDAVQTFSGGMKRRLNIAAGLIHRPKVLLLDEPTVGVDPQSRNFIFEHIEKLRDEGLSVVYTTHYMEEAERLCDRIAIIDQGRIVALDTAEALLGLLKGGVIHAVLDVEDLETLRAAVAGLGHVVTASVRDRRMTMETSDVRHALAELVELSRERDAHIVSLEVLEPTLESVFLHVTGKRLRD